MSSAFGKIAVKPLNGIRVLDLSRVLAGPWCTQLLADLGADVIKVEKPGQGDDTRKWGPPYLKGQNGQETKESAYFLSANRGKKSLAVDISKVQGQRIIRSLVEKSDILVENYKVGGLSKYGLGYHDLASINKGLIYCSITGFGQTGPRKDEAGYDFMIQGMSGMMSVTGEKNGSPMKVGVAVCDILTGLYASNAIQSALIQKLKTREGQYIDMALLDVSVASMANQAFNYLVSGIYPKRLGNSHPNITPYDVVEAKDGFFIIAVGNDEQFRKFCLLAGCVDLSNDPRFSTNESRVRNRKALMEIISSPLKSKAVGEWLRELAAVGVPCSKVNNMDEVFKEPQVESRSILRKIPHQTGVDCPTVANPIRFGEHSLTATEPPPSLGQHTRQILDEVLGYSESQIYSLRKEGVVST